jgi:hypothetical protein
MKLMNISEMVEGLEELDEYLANEVRITPEHSKRVLINKLIRHLKMTDAHLDSINEKLDVLVSFTKPQ